MRLPWLHPHAPTAFPPTALALTQPNGLLCAGGDLAPARLLAAYARGIFPWYSPGEPILWWSPQPRCVLPLHLARPARRLLQRWRQLDWHIRADADFTAVLEACAAARAGQSGTWITAEMQSAYTELHAAGHAHCIAVHDAAQTLVGGIYGIALGGVFFGESMFSRASDGSKTALFALAWVLRQRGAVLLDGQVESPHLRRLGFECWSRNSFEAALARHTQPVQPGSWQAQWPLADTRVLAQAWQASAETAAD